MLNLKTSFHNYGLYSTEERFEDPVGTHKITCYISVVRQVPSPSAAPLQPE
jgi:hypothetical protein